MTYAHRFTSPRLRGRPFLLAAAMVVGSTGCSSQAKDSAGATANPPPAVTAAPAAAPSVATREAIPPASATRAPAAGAVSLSPALGDRPLEIAGDLKPAQAAELSFKVGGHLARMMVKRGDHVADGDVLAVLADPEARAQAAQAEAAVRGAQAQLALAEDQAKRMHTLGEAKAAPGSLTVSSKLQADAARAGVAAAQAALQLARANVQNHVLRAPFAGVVTRVPEGVGTTVGPGLPVLRLEQLDVLVLQATVSEAELPTLKVGEEVTVVTSGGREITGKVRAVLGSLESMSRRAPVEIEVPNTDGSLPAGAYVRARRLGDASARR